MKIENVKTRTNTWKIITSKHILCRRFHTKHQKLTEPKNSDKLLLHFFSFYPVTIMLLIFFSEQSIWSYIYSIRKLTSSSKLQVLAFQRKSATWQALFNKKEYKLLILYTLLKMFWLFFLQILHVLASEPAWSKQARDFSSGLFVYQRVS